MKTMPNLWLILALVMFPQVVETIYSPALPHISHAFGVTAQTASQTISVYFIAFAFGVLVWGRLSDTLGRRKAMLFGLVTYGLGATLAIFATSFETLMLARILSAFGAATGSVVTQAMLRDCYKGAELTKAFSLITMGVSISPVIGLLSGGIIVTHFGYSGIFCSLLMLAIALWLLAILTLSETNPDMSANAESDKGPEIGILQLAKQMSRDTKLWCNAGLIAAFNIMLYSYYSLGPFIFHDLGMSSTDFGYSGVLLPIGTILGSLLSKRLISKGWQSHQLISAASVLALIFAFGVWLLRSDLLFLIPMIGMLLCSGMALPNIFSKALENYRHAVGTAGALFGLTYYLLFGAGLALTGILQDLGMALILSASLSCLLSVKLNLGVVANKLLQESSCK
ncbi:multidrug effflux MFS transporter [Shewanella violacea]|uniref:Bcr/CflA family efflux transporter n=1 Tax=Shewanella violacea (strain JCM 10179 / CIP 106290 / LMG 19151 / DSS12) TaxID=637905 RepID=D4ZAZ4_SHEVD|nr:multidrug effflux MFS transporter [Shewanella violacea]BAJ03189.1 drug resistance transporter, Bcr/CflA family protein [Shewanella violacea DSS12]